MVEIWILDDDRGILEVIQMILEGTGYMVRVFSSTTRLKKDFKESLPDLFLFDVLLAGENGAEFAKQCKGRPLLSKIPIILMSAQGNLKEKCRISGAEDYIVKPFDIDELQEKIKKVIEENKNPSNRASV